MKKILIIPTRRHIVESYYEYLIRYLSDEFIIHQACAPYPPYEEFAKNPLSNGNNPLMKNPDDYDLLVPHFTTHWNVWGDQHWNIKDKDYSKKIGLVVFEPEGFNEKVAVTGATTTAVENNFTGKKYHKLRFGVDTEMFKPLNFKREDNLLRVGFVGNFLTPRRYLKDLFMPLIDLEGVKLMIFPSNWANHTRPDEIESCGGDNFIKSIAGGDMWYSGLPNMYNQIDVLVRCDIDPGYHFPILEAASCGVPVVWCDKGFCPELDTEYRGGILTGNGNGTWQPKNLKEIAAKIRQAVIYLRDNEEGRKEMGSNARKFILDNYTWDKWIPAWREYFREGLANAQM